MKTAIIKIAFRQIIDASGTTDFEQKVLSVSYDEFLLKSQAYNIESKFKTFSEMKRADGRANSLHYKSGFGASALVESLNNIIPGLQDTLGKPIHFETYQFEIIESDITDINLHKVAIIYFTSSLTLFDNFGNHLILAT